MSKEQLQKVNTELAVKLTSEYQSVEKVELEASEHEAYMAFKLGKNPSYQLYK